MSDNTMPSELWIEYRRGYGGVSERNIDGMTAYIRADVCAERQNAVQREVHVERMRADGLRKQLDAANARIAELEALALTLVDELEDSEETVIHEYSGNIGNETKQMRVKMNEYRQQIKLQS